ncbi:putative transcriptional regulator, ModE family [uncultured Paludibacter sp.]|nr:putative transcriptional regulator, ModE family [uncultured Paludibacter sp.]
MKHYSAFYFDAKLILYRNEEIFISEIQIKILKQVLIDGSINEASKNLKMSYQHVWHILDKLNRLSPLPIIIRQKGGRDGGGCHLSPYGVKIINFYESKANELADYLQTMNQDIEKCFF